MGKKSDVYFNFLVNLGCKWNLFKISRNCIRNIEIKDVVIISFVFFNVINIYVGMRINLFWFVIIKVCFFIFFIFFMGKKF